MPQKEKKQPQEEKKKPFMAPAMVSVNGGPPVQCIVQASKGIVSIAPVLGEASGTVNLDGGVPKFNFKS